MWSYPSTFLRTQRGRSGSAGRTLLPRRRLPGGPGEEVQDVVPGGVDGRGAKGIAVGRPPHYEGLVPQGRTDRREQLIGWWGYL